MKTGTIIVLTAIGVGAGAGAAYYLHPSKGKRRRRMVRLTGLDWAYRTRKAGLKAADKFRTNADHISAAIEGLGSRIPWGGDPLERLEERLARKVNRLAFPLKYMVENGRVTLSGPILAEEADKLITAVSRIPGVEEIVNNLDLRVRMADVEQLKDKTKLDLGSHWPPSPRVLIGTGSTLGAIGLGIATRLIAQRLRT